MSGRILVIQHEDDAPPAWFGEWLSAAGAELDVRFAHLGDPIPTDLADHDALLVLGGEMGANDDDEHAWLAPTKALIARTVDEEKPFLGICLGHQLATAALGGTVIVNPLGQALGLTPVTPTAAAAEDPLLGGVRLGARAVQWNRDIAAELPAGAETLALAPDGTVQAARFGPCAWGVQFHPEASPDVFDSWIESASPELLLVAQTALAEIRAAEADLRADWAPLAERFAQVVGSSVVVP